MKRAHKSMLRILTLSFFLTGAGCLYIPTPHHSLLAGRGMIEEATIQHYQPGVTTRAEILLNLGEPDATLSSQSIFVYTWTRTQGYLVMGGYGRGEILTIGSTSLLLMEFDDRNCLKRVKLSFAGMFSSAMREAADWAADRTPR